MATPWISESTDVANDPRRLLAMAQGHGRQAKFAQELLKEMIQQQQFAAGHQQQAQQFALSHAQQERQRQDALDARVEAHRDNISLRRAQERGTEAYRQDSLRQGTERAKVAKADALLRAAEQEVGDTPRKRAYVDQYNKLMGIDTSNIPADAKTPAQSALERVADRTGGATQTGQGTAPSPTSVAPSAAAAKAQAQPQTAAPAPAPAAGATFATTDLYGDEGEPAAPALPPGQYMAPDGLPHIGGSPVIPENRLIQHGQIYGGPAGQDLNINTGEWVPSNQQGTINGKPAGQYLAEHAQGVEPESASGRIAYAQAQKFPGLSTTPPMDISLVPPPESSGVTPETVGGGRTHGPNYIGLGTPTEAPAVAGKPFVGSPELFSGSGVPPLVGGGPQGPGPKPPDINVDKFLSEHVGGPTMEALRNQQVSSGQIPPAPGAPPPGAPASPPNDPGFERVMNHNQIQPYDFNTGTPTPGINPAPNEAMNPGAIPKIGAPVPWSPEQLAAGSRPLTDNAPGGVNAQPTPQQLAERRRTQGY